LPEDHPEDRFKGKQASFTVMLNELNSRTLPEIDQAFLAEFGEKIKTEADFDQMIEDELKSYKDQEHASLYREELKSQIVEKLDFTLPETLLKSEVDFRQHQLSHAPENKEKKEEDLALQAEKEAVEYLRLNRFIHRYMEEHGLTPEDNSVWQRFSMQASMMGQKPMELVRTDYGRQFYNDVYQTMSEESVLDHIVKELLS